MLETIKIIVEIVLIVLLALIALVLHRIGTIRKWEIENEREARKQSEFWEE